MKKRTIALLLSMALSISLFGCGSENSSEPKQETNADVEQEVNVGTEQESDAETEDNFAGAEDDNIVLYAERGQQDYCPLNETEYTASEGTIIANEDVPLYNESGYAVGYIKTGATVKITEAGTTLAWTRFENPIAGTDYDYLYVLKEYLDEQQEEPIIEEKTDTEETSPQDEILAKSGYDKDKTYTADEYIEILTKIFEEMGKTYNADVEKDFINKTTLDGYHTMMSYYVFDFSDHEDTLQNTKYAMSYVEGGLDGASNIVEFAISKGSNSGEETINVYVKVAN